MTRPAGDLSGGKEAASVIGVILSILAILTAWGMRNWVSGWAANPFETLMWLSLRIEPA